MVLYSDKGTLHYPLSERNSNFTFPVVLRTQKYIPPKVQMECLVKVQKIFY